MLPYKLIAPWGCCGSIARLLSISICCLSVLVTIDFRPPRPLVGPTQLVMSPNKITELPLNPSQDLSVEIFFKIVDICNNNEIMIAYLPCSVLILKSLLRTFSPVWTLLWVFSNQRGCNAEILLGRRYGRLVGVLIGRQTAIRWLSIRQTANFWPWSALDKSMALIQWKMLTMRGATWKCLLL